MNESGERCAIKISTALRVRKSAHLCCVNPPNGTFHVQVLPLEKSKDWIVHPLEPSKLSWNRPACIEIVQSCTSVHGDIASLPIHVDNVLKPNLQYAVRLCKTRLSGQVRQLGPIHVLDFYLPTTPARPRLRTVLDKNNSHWIIWELRESIMAPLPRKWELQICDSLKQDAKWRTIWHDKVSHEAFQHSYFAVPVMEHTTNAGKNIERKELLDRKSTLKVWNWRIRLNCASLLAEKLSKPIDEVTSTGLTLRIRGINDHGQGEWSSSDSERANFVTGKSQVLERNEIAQQFSTILKPMSTRSFTPDSVVPPKDLKIIHASATSLTIEWSYLVHDLLQCGVLEFECEASQDGAVWGVIPKVLTYVPCDCSMDVENCGTSGRTYFRCVIPGLKSLNRYVVRVRTRNAIVGWGIYSQHVMGRTCCSTVPCPPRWVTSEATSVRNVTVKWPHVVTLEANGGSPVTEYIVDLFQSPYTMKGTEFLPYDLYERVERKRVRRSIVSVQKYSTKKDPKSDIFCTVFKSLPLNIAWEAKVRARNASGIGTYQCTNNQHWPAVTGFEPGDIAIALLKHPAMRNVELYWEVRVEGVTESKSAPDFESVLRVTITTTGEQVIVPDTKLYTVQDDLPELKGKHHEMYTNVISSVPDMIEAIHEAYRQTIVIPKTILEYTWFQERHEQPQDTVCLNTLETNHDIEIAQQYDTWSAPRVNPKNAQEVFNSNSKLKEVRNHLWHSHSSAINEKVKHLHKFERCVSLPIQRQRVDELLQLLGSIEVQSFIKENQNLTSFFNLGNLNDLIHTAKLVHDLHQLEINDCFLVANNSNEKVDKVKQELKHYYEFLVASLTRNQVSTRITLQDLNQFATKRKFVSNYFERHPMLKPLRDPVVRRWLTDELVMLNQVEATVVPIENFIEAGVFAIQQYFDRKSLDIASRLVIHQQQSSLSISNLQKLQSVDTLSKYQVMNYYGDPQFRNRVLRMLQTGLSSSPTNSELKQYFIAASLCAAREQKLMLLIDLVLNSLTVQEDRAPPPPTMDRNPTKPNERKAPKPAMSKIRKPKAPPRRTSLDTTTPNELLDDRHNNRRRYSIEEQKDKRYIQLTELIGAGKSLKANTNLASTLRLLQHAIPWLMQEKRHSSTLLALVGHTIHCIGHRKKVWGVVGYEQGKFMLIEKCHMYSTYKATAQLYTAMDQATGNRVRISNIKSMLEVNKTPRDILDENIQLMSVVPFIYYNKYVAQMAYMLTNKINKAKGTAKMENYNVPSINTALGKLEPSVSDGILPLDVFQLLVDQAWFEKRLFNTMHQILLMLEAFPNIDQPGLAGSGFSAARQVKQFQGERVSASKSGLDQENNLNTETKLNKGDENNQVCQQNNQTVICNKEQNDEGGSKEGQVQTVGDVISSPSNSIQCTTNPAFKTNAATSSEQSSMDPEVDQSSSNSLEQSQASINDTQENYQTDSTYETDASTTKKLKEAKKIEESNDNVDTSVETPQHKNTKQSDSNNFELYANWPPFGEVELTSKIDWEASLPLHKCEVLLRLAASQIWKQGDLIAAPLVTSDAALKSILLSLYQVYQLEMFESQQHKPPLVQLSTIFLVSTMIMVRECIIAEFSFYVASTTNGFKLQKANKRDPSQQRVMLSAFTLKQLQLPRYSEFLRQQRYTQLLLFPPFHHKFCNKLVEILGTNVNTTGVSAEVASKAFVDVYNKESGLLLKAVKYTTNKHDVEWNHELVSLILRSLS